MTSKEALDTIYNFAIIGIYDEDIRDFIRVCYNIIADNLKKGGRK